MQGTKEDAVKAIMRGGMNPVAMARSTRGANTAAVLAAADTTAAAAATRDGGVFAWVLELSCMVVRRKQVGDHDAQRMHVCVIYRIASPCIRSHGMASHQISSHRIAAYSRSHRRSHRMHTGRLQSLSLDLPLTCLDPI